MGSVGWDSWRHVDPTTPVLVGVGRAGQQLDEPGAGRTALQLLQAAVDEALVDSGSATIAGAIDVVAMPKGTWGYRNPGRVIADAVGAKDARTVLVEAGIPQQTLFNDAYRAIDAGQARVVLVVGGEAARRDALARRAGIRLLDPEPETGEPDEHRWPTGEIVSAAEIAARVVSPVEQYALIDSALRAAEGRSLGAHKDEIAELWSRFNEAAATFEPADFPAPLDAQAIRDPGPDNRLMASPYNKWHCSQMNVDQAAAVLVSRLDTAEQLGVDPDQVIFVLAGVESSFSAAVPARGDLHRWPAMEVIGAATSAHLGIGLADLDYVETYSCFPAAVRVQQRALGLPVDGTPTLTGGASFAGGPWNNFVLQATVAMVHQLRKDRGSRGLVTTVSGFLTKPGLGVYSTEPGAGRPLVADLHSEAEAATATLPIVVDYDGPAIVAAYTVVPERSGGARTVVIADTPNGERCLATSPAEEIAATYTVAELIGQRISVSGTTFELAAEPSASPAGSPSISPSVSPSSTTPSP